MISRSSSAVAVMPSRAARDARRALDVSLIRNDVLAAMAVSSAQPVYRSVALMRYGYLRPSLRWPPQQASREHVEVESIGDLHRLGRQNRSTLISFVKLEAMFKRREPGSRAALGGSQSGSQ